VRGYLDLLDRSADIYSGAPDDVRRELLQAFFAKLLVESSIDGIELGKSRTTPNETIHALEDEIQKDNAHASVARQTKIPRTNAGDLSLVSNAVQISLGLNKTTLVGPMRVYLTNSEDPLTPDHLASLLARATSGEARDRAPVRIQRLSARLGADKCAELCRKYAAGETAQSLAHEYGVSKPAVLTLLRFRNVTVRVRRMSQRQITEAVRKYEAGKSIAQVAKLLGFHPAAVWRALKVQGVEMRPKGFQPKIGPVQP
jgi:hypothetical protein